MLVIFSACGSWKKFNQSATFTMLNQNIAEHYSRSQKHAMKQDAGDLTAELQVPWDFIQPILLKWEPNHEIHQIFPRTFSHSISKIIFRIFNAIPIYSGN